MANALDRIENIVVLMLENGSFDRMLGFLRGPDYPVEGLTVLTTLAREFAVCDHWFSSVPGPTWPNRMFVHAASSAGRVDDEVNPLLYDIDTIYDRLDEAGRAWKIYFHDIPQALSLRHL